MNLPSKNISSVDPSPPFDSSTENQLIGPVREAFHLKKRGYVGIGPKWRRPPPPPSGVGTFLNLGLFGIGLTPSHKINLGIGTFLKQNDPLTKFRNNLNMNKFGTKSINMSDILVFWPCLVQLLIKYDVFWVFILLKMKMSHYFSVCDTLWNFFKFFDDPPPLYPYLDLIKR